LRPCAEFPRDGRGEGLRVRVIKDGENMHRDCQLAF
jgi:hypothetical protein